MIGFRIVDCGIATSIQDQGRPGYAHLGLGRSGAVDLSAAGVLNRALGNSEAAPVVETAGGLVLECVSRCLIATSNWTSPRLVVEGEAVRVNPEAGRQWAYLAVSGGFSGAPILGSLSADSMADLIAVDVSTGAELQIGRLAVGPPTDLIPSRQAHMEISVLPGPHLDRLGSSALLTLTSTDWVVENNSRVGIRLTGGVLELPKESANGQSEPMIVGAVQVPPSGHPIVLGRDHPVTGGYPVAAVVDDSDISAALGAAVGSTLRFRVR